LQNKAVSFTQLLTDTLIIDPETTEARGKEKKQPRHFLFSEL